MPRTKPAYSREFGKRILDLARAGRTISSLAQEFGAHRDNDPKLDLDLPRIRGHRVKQYLGGVGKDKGRHEEEIHQGVQA